MSETLRPNPEIKSINAVDDEQCCASMQNMSIDILRRLHELACDIALIFFSKPGMKVGFDAANTKICPRKPLEDPKYHLEVNVAADQQLHGSPYIRSVPQTRLQLS